MSLSLAKQFPCYVPFGHTAPKNVNAWAAAEVTDNIFDCSHINKRQLIGHYQGLVWLEVVPCDVVDEVLFCCRQNDIELTSDFAAREAKRRARWEGAGACKDRWIFKYLKNSCQTTILSITLSHVYYKSSNMYDLKLRMCCHAYLWRYTFFYVLHSR